MLVAFDGRLPSRACSWLHPFFFYRDQYTGFQDLYAIFLQLLISDRCSKCRLLWSLAFSKGQPLWLIFVLPLVRIKSCPHSLHIILSVLGLQTSASHQRHWLIRPVQDWRELVLGHETEEVAKHSAKVGEYRKLGQAVSENGRLPIAVEQVPLLSPVSDDQRQGTEWVKDGERGRVEEAHCYDGEELGIVRFEWEYFSFVLVFVLFLGLAGGDLLVASVLSVAPSQEFIE